MTLTATLSLNEASAREWDVIVIGAGPAGALAARQVARTSARTLLVERKAFPRTKVCGACLNQAALSALDSAGLLGKITALGGQPLRSFHMQCGRRILAVPLPGGIAVSRNRLDAALAEAAVDAGAEFLPECAATVQDLEVTAGGEMRKVALLGSDATLSHVRGRVVLVADGLGHSSLDAHPEFASRVHPQSRIGLGRVQTESPDFYRPGTIYMAVGASGYVGLVRVEDGRLNVAAAILPAFLKDHAAASPAIAAILAEAGLPPLFECDSGSWQGTLPLTRQSAQLAGRRILLLGDAAGYVEPFTGEGMAWALSVAIQIEPIVRCGLREWDRGLESEWSRTVRRLVRRRQRWCRVLSALLRHPRASRWLITALSCVPPLVSPIVRGLNAPARRVERFS